MVMSVVRLQVQRTSVDCVVMNKGMIYRSASILLDSISILRVYAHP
jgi:hypothetical protein